MPSCTCDTVNEPGFPHRQWCATMHDCPGPDCPGLCEPAEQPEPQLSDFASIAAYRAARAAASPEDRLRWSAESDAKLFAAIVAAGGRTVDCAHGYHWHDSCPTCD